MPSPFSQSSAGGQLEQPWDVKSSTKTGLSPAWALGLIPKEARAKPIQKVE
jgi:hypothetical protein